MNVAFSSERALSDLVNGLIAVPETIRVNHISLDSRQVGRKGLFLACQGRRAHGLQGLPEALAQGASAVLWEPAPGVEAPDTERLAAAGVFVAPVPSLSRQAGDIAARFFDQPSSALQICGITGTNGKTTTAWLIAQLFDALGMRGAYVGTLGVYRVGGELESSSLTTADAVGVQRQLASLRAQGAQHVAIEVSSHALDQHRVDAVQMQVAAFTNLSRDHLDYHGTMEAYAACKSRLMTWSGLKGRVINVDDALGRELAERYADTDRATSRMVLTTRSLAGGEFAQQLAHNRPHVIVLKAQSLQPIPQGMQFSLSVQQIDVLSTEYSLRVPLLGEFNVDNLLIALGILRVLDVNWDQVLACLATLAAPPGRMEALTAPGKPLVIVDYAHTPDALQKALTAARVHCTGRLQVVFGCGGERDRGKRSLMGRVAAQAADHIILTDDNPRGESPIEIIGDILQGVQAQGVTTPNIIHDRREAIREAVRSAREGDVVLVAGKGHEDYQILGARRLPASDRGWVREALQA